MLVAIYKRTIDPKESILTWYRLRVLLKGMQTWSCLQTRTPLLTVAKRCFVAFEKLRSNAWIPHDHMSSDRKRNALSFGNWHEIHARVVYGENYTTELRKSLALAFVHSHPKTVCLSMCHCIAPLLTGCWICSGLAAQVNSTKNTLIFGVHLHASRKGFNLYKYSCSLEAPYSPSLLGSIRSKTVPPSSADRRSKPEDFVEKWLQWSVITLLHVNHWKVVGPPKQNPWLVTDSIPSLSYPPNRVQAQHLQDVERSSKPEDFVEKWLKCSVITLLHVNHWKVVGPPKQNPWLVTDSIPSLSYPPNRVQAQHLQDVERSSKPEDFVEKWLKWSVITLLHVNHWKVVGPSKQNPWLVTDSIPSLSYPPNRVQAPHLQDVERSSKPEDLW